MEWEIKYHATTCTSNGWRVKYGVGYDDTMDFFIASKYNDDEDITITACNVWENPIMDLSCWPDCRTVENIYFEIEKAMVSLFARELEQLGEDMSIDGLRQFFTGRYTAGVDYIFTTKYRDDPRVSIIIYVSEPHEFIREMQRLQGASAFQYNATDMLSFLDADESEVEE